MTIRTLIGSCLAFVCLTTEARAQFVEMPWPKRLTASDRRDLLALAKKMGMHGPLTIRRGGVESIQSVNDHEFRWSFAWMVRDGDRMSTDGAPHVGQWYAVGPMYESGRWRIRDASWSHDVSFHLDDPAVNYEDAVRVVLAIHQRKLINRQTEHANGDNIVQTPIPDLDASPISWFAKPDVSLWHWLEQSTGDVLKADASRTYQVTTNHIVGHGGYELIVRVTAEGVELLASVGYEI